MVPVLTVVEGVPVWSGGAGAEIDLWFIPAFGETHLCFREAFERPIAQAARILVFEPPGFGAAPPRAEGLGVHSFADLFVSLAAKVSGNRPVVCAAHSMASIAAGRAALRMGEQLRLILSIEGNLTQADAFLTGQAVGHSDARAFHAAFIADVLARVRGGTLPVSYYASLQFADPHTLWTLGRSVAACRTPGEELLRLRARVIYYWDAGSVPDETRAFLQTSGLRQRRMDGSGHWPMLTRPGAFYDAVLEDIRGVA